MFRRSQLHIITEILEAAEQRRVGVRKTPLVYRCNLNFRLIEGYLQLLVEKGFLKLIESEGAIFYQITTSGLQALETIRTAVKLVNREAVQAYST